MKKASLVPVKSAPPQRLTNDEKYDAPAINRFISHIDRDLLEFFLDQDEKYRTFLRALHDSSQAHLSFRALMKRYSITLPELHAIYTDGKRHMGLIQMANNLPQVLTRISHDAEFKLQHCERCDGRGLVHDDWQEGQLRQCPVCDGIGKVEVEGSKDSRQQMLEAMKILGKGGPAVVVNQQFGSHGLEEELQVTQKIVMGDRS